MAGSSKYLNSLARVPLFVACSKRELQKIARAVDEVEVDADREIVKQDGVARECFVIVEGEAAVKRNGRRIKTLGPGDHFGELALLDRGPRTASVVAVTPMKLLVLGPREFTALIDEVPGLALKIMGSLAATIRELDAKIYP
jgi:CRP/FNR family cyclic AMP-dependent transcriptional regulator